MGPLVCSLVVLAVLHTALSQNKPPEITIPDKKDTEYIFEDGNVTLTCSATATPPATYKWKFNGEVLTSASVSVDSTTGVLKINPFTSAFEGTYQCLAENEISPGKTVMAMSPVITLKEISLELREWEPSDQPVESGEKFGYMSMTCDDPPASVPPPQFGWHTAAGQVELTDRIYIDDKGTLHFVYLLMEDANDYQCGVRNTKLEIIKLGGDKTLEVQDSDATGADAVLRYFTQQPRFLTTRTAELECVFSGMPVPVVTWYDMRDGKSPQQIVSSPKGKYEITDEGRKLTIAHLQEGDEGDYKCEGKNSGGTDSGVISLDVTSGPIWVKALTTKTAVEGKDAIFHCVARPAEQEKGLNKPTWFKDGKEIKTEDTQKFQWSDEDRVLTVKNLSKTTDIMCFQCNVSNEIGYELGDGCLNVIEPIVVTTAPDLTQEISKGDIVNLTVIGKTDPAYNLTYIWYFRNISYKHPDSPPFVIFNATTLEAYINTTDLTDEEYKSINGTYIRGMFHVDDRLNVTIDVILQKEIVVAPVVAAGMDLWWVALIVALVILLIIFIIIVIICQRKKQAGTYPLDKKERASHIDPEKDIADTSFHNLDTIPLDDEFPQQKGSKLDLDDDMINDDDSELLMYDANDPDTRNFNEDGSFIGQYGKKK